MGDTEELQEVEREACVIAICTYRRPMLLRALIKKVNSQDFSGTDGNVHLLIVDNDSEQSAKVIFDECATYPTGATMHYLSIQPQGLVVARNAALDFAKVLNAAVIFIDDDESPAEGWFASFWEMHLLFPQDVIAGPVVPDFEEPIPSWCKDGSYWKRQSFEDASLLLRPTGDGNIFYPRALVQNWRYSLRYNTSGAQDTHLLRRWIASGRGLRWSAKAVVTEIVPAGRLTFSYALDRAYFSSLAYVWVDRELGANAVWTLLRAVRRLSVGLRDYTVSLLRRDIWLRHRARLHFSSARGTLHGLRVKSFDRYGKYQIDVSTSP